jgi:NAD(P)-dependent dehydrogenase (short-subunit alcohol dehydrogenase family)
MTDAPLTALVTGASRGIGAEIARQLASRGVRVALHCGRNTAMAEEVLRTLPGEGHTVHTANLEDPNAVDALWRAVGARHPRIEILINNAGEFVDHPPLRSSAADWLAAWQRTLGTNLIAAAQLAHHAANEMAKLSVRTESFGRGRLVQISSRGAFRGEPDAPAYGASKAGLNAMSQSLAKALAPAAVYSYCLAPGWVGTDMARGHVDGPAGAEILAQHPLGRITRPDELAAAAVWCALDAPAAMTGAILDVNGASYLRT